MGQITVKLDGEEEKRGSEDSYRDKLYINVDEDEENEDQLKFSTNGKNIFIKKEDIKELIHVFKIS